MKTTTSHNSSIHIVRQQHPVRNALGMILLSGAITAVIVAATVEIVGGIVTSTGPTNMTHVIAALLAIPIGYAVAMSLAVGELAHGMDVMFDRVVSDVQGIRTHASEAADAQIASEHRHVVHERVEDVPQITKSVVPTGMMAGLMESVEHDRVERSAQALQPVSPD